MNLKRRTSLLLLPVIAISYMLSSWWIYQEERTTLLQLESAKLEQRISSLRSSVLNYKGFQDAYAMSLIDGDLLAKFLLDYDNIYRTQLLQRHMESSLSRFDSVEKPKLSLYIVDSHDRVMLYLENSQDPFAQPGTRQQKLSRELRKNKQVDGAAIEIGAKGQLILYRSHAIDVRTLKPPIPSQVNNAAMLIVAIEMPRISNEMELVKSHYRAQVYLPGDNRDDSNISTHRRNFYIPLYGDQSIEISVPLNYLDRALGQLGLRLVLLTAIFCLATYLLLRFLVGYYLTEPISKLDKQLDELLSRRRSELSLVHSNDEIGRLAKKFHNLYDRLLSSYTENYNKARHDVLTGLPNRTAFNEKSEQWFGVNCQACTMIVCYIDIDNFKFINDKYGHDIGDNVLTEVSRGLEEVLNDLVFDENNVCGLFRLSGDEFVFLAKDLDKQQVMGHGERILSLFDQGVSIAGAIYPVTVSIGLAQATTEDCEFSTLMSNVDLAMYQAKQQGKNCIFEYSESLATQQRRKQDIIVGVQSSSFENELSIYYMPIVDHNKKLCAFEALLRWDSPALGRVPPDEFISLAESIGLYRRIDAWVIEEVFRTQPQVRELFPDVDHVSINISSAELDSSSFVDVLSELTTKYAVNSEFFVLEVTETFSVAQQQQVTKNLSDIRKLGFAVAIDDFGTGYTSVMQMLNYPADIIKFDRSLIARISRPGYTKTAKKLVELCKLQGLLVVAEGIETEDQYQSVCEMGFEFQQGYLHGKAMPIEQLAQALKKDSDISVA